MFPIHSAHLVWLPLSSRRGRNPAQSGPPGHPWLLSVCLATAWRRLWRSGAAWRNTSPVPVLTREVISSLWMWKQRKRTAWASPRVVQRWEGSWLQWAYSDQKGLGVQSRTAEIHRDELQSTNPLLLKFNQWYHHFKCFTANTQNNRGKMTLNEKKGQETSGGFFGNHRFKSNLLVHLIKSFSDFVWDFKPLSGCLRVPDLSWTTKRAKLDLWRENRNLKMEAVPEGGGGAASFFRLLLNEVRKMFESERKMWWKKHSDR